MTVRNYQDLIVWQRAMDLVEWIYRATRPFPSEERFGLTSQLRRAVVSIPSNIAEGQGRETTRDFLRFLWIAHGSLREVETHVMIANRLEFLEDDPTNDLLARASEVGRLLNGLIARLDHKAQFEV